MGVYYNKYEKLGAVHWKAWREGTHNYRELVESSLQPFDDIEKGSVMDLGGGDGVSAYLLAKKGFVVTVVDYNKKALKLLKKEIKEQCEIDNVNNLVPIKFDEIDIGLYIPEQDFDYMYSLNTIEHIDNSEDFVRLMDYIKKFAVIVTDDKRLGRSNMYHHREFEPSEFEELFESFKLERLKITPGIYFGYKVYANRN